jgi:hypothetical protein
LNKWLVKLLDNDWRIVVQWVNSKVEEAVKLKNCPASFFGKTATFSRGSGKSLDWKARKAQFACKLPPVMEW